MEGYYKPYKKQRQRVRYVKKGQQPHFTEEKPIQTANIPSDEPGFMGDPKTWFSEEEFNKQFAGCMDYKVGSDSYFSSYSHFYIHEEMLKDRIRTGSYMDACLKNKEQFKDKIVLDIGCGTGILSIFAVRAGAKHVYGIDNAEIADFARAIVKENGLQDQITILKGKMEEIKLPVDKVDIIISEWMGYFLLYEAMLDTVLYARDKYLKPDGLMLPDRVTMNMSAVQDSKYKKDKYGFWDSVYNTKMSVLKDVAQGEPLVDLVNRKQAISNICKFFDIDLYTVKVSDLDFANKYELKMIRTDMLDGIVCWFDAHFSKLKNPVTLSTSIYSQSTHWKQTLFYLQKSFMVKTGETLNGTIAVKKSSIHFRNVDVVFTFHYKDDEKTVDYKQLYRLV